MAKEFTTPSGAKVTEGGELVSGPTGTSTPDTSDFLKTLQDRLLGQSDIVSTEGGLDKFTEGIEAFKEAGVAGREGIISEADILKGDITESREKTRKDVLSRQRGVGFATTQARLEEFDTVTEKKLKDLASAKNAALRNNDTKTAASIAELELQEMTFSQKIRQDAITNLFAGASLQQQDQAQKQAASQFKQNLDFQKLESTLRQNEKIASIAAEYGVEISPGETLQSIVTKVSPMASKIKKAELAALLKESQGTEGADFSAQLGIDITEGMSPFEAAKKAIATMEAIGLKPSIEDLNRFRSLGEGIQLELQIRADKATAEQQAKSLALKATFDMMGKGLLTSTPQALLKKEETADDKRLREVNESRARIDLAPLEELPGKKADGSELKFSSLADESQDFFSNLFNL